jgi:isocitrate/isopropylmalate dehydrogenase
MPPKDRYHVVTLPGDGIGPEVTLQAVAALRGACGRHDVRLDFEELPGGGEYYMEHGREWPHGSEERCAAADAILLGGVGAQHPETRENVFTRPGEPYATPQLAGYAQVIDNRQRLQLYVNVRPIRLYPGVRHQVSGRFMSVWQPDNVDYVVCRENTEEAYTGRSDDARGEDGRTTARTTPLIVTRVATERVCRYAYRLARKRKLSGHPGKVTCVVKSNIVGAHRFFEEIYREVGEREFPDIEQDVAMFDAFCMWQMRNPEWYDVVVAPNLVGDVISDNGSTTQGGMGLAAGANIGDEHGMFEPIHGSAPKHAGKNIACPLGAVGAVGMMLDYVGETAGAARIERAVTDLLTSGAVPSADARSGISTTAMGDMVIERLKP